MAPTDPHGPRRRARPRDYLRDLRTALTPTTTSNNRKATTMPSKTPTHSADQHPHLHAARLLAHPPKGVAGPATPPTYDALPDDVRREYDAAPAPSLAELLEYAEKAKMLRADQAEAAWHNEYNRLSDKRGPGSGPMSPNLPRREDVVKAGIAPEKDEPMGEHMYRLAYAKRVLDQRAEVAERQRKRMAAQCRTCGALDVPTQSVRIELIPPRVRTNRWGGKDTPYRLDGDVVTLSGGPVCVLCEVSIRTEYLSDLAGEQLTDGRTRAQAARDYINGRK